MSKATKRKHVIKETLDEFFLPKENQTIVKILGGRGNNLHEVETSSGEKFLASMPTKFRKNVWVKRGDYVIVEPIEEGDKVKAEIAHVLYKEQIKYIESQGQWPKEFKKSGEAPNQDVAENESEGSGSSSDEDEDSDSDLFVNTNRLQPGAVNESESSDGSSESD
nr:EOG090X0KPP [Eulimnadia texana]